MKPQKSYRNMLIIFSLLAAGFLAAYYFAYEDVKAKNEHVSSLVQDLDFQSSRQEYLVSTQRMIQNINADIERIDNSIVASDGDVGFIEKLESVAKDNGLSITIDSLVIEDDPAFIASGITTLKVKAKTKGTWTGTYTFISELESLPFKIRINQFGMVNDAEETPAGVKQSGSSWQGAFEIRVLKYK